MTNENIIEQDTNTEPNKKKRLGVAVACGLLAGTLAVGSAVAYLTGFATVENPFSLDTNLKIELTEPAFSADAAKDLAPLQAVAKDPTVTNKGTVPVYVAMDIKVPVFSGKAIVGDAIVDQTDADLFIYTVNSGWTQVGTPTVADGYRTYRYVYGDTLAAAAKTSAVFDQVTLANLTEDVGIADTQIDVTAHAIQAEGFSSANDAISAYDAQAAMAAEASL